VQQDFWFRWSLKYLNEQVHHKWTKGEKINSREWSRRKISHVFNKRLVKTRSPKLIPVQMELYGQSRSERIAGELKQSVKSICPSKYNMTKRGKYVTSKMRTYIYIYVYICIALRLKPSSDHRLLFRTRKPANDQSATCTTTIDR